MSNNIKEALLSYGRGLIAAVGTVVFFIVLDPKYDINVLLTTEGVKALGVAALGAALKFTYDWLRLSNDKFGRGKVPAPVAGNAPEQTDNGPTELDPPQYDSQEMIVYGEPE
jgi:hypothetical protein